MAFDPDDAVFLHLCASGSGARLCATGAREFIGGWRGNARPDEIEAELCRLTDALDGLPVMVYNARMTGELLSRSTSSEAEELRSRFRDLMTGVLLACPTLHDLSLTSVARAFLVDCGDTPAAALDDPAPGAALCRDLAVTVRGRLSGMAPGIHAIIRELLFSDVEMSWLGLHEPAPPVETDALGMLLEERPAVPRNRQRKRATMETPPSLAAAALFDDDGPIAGALDGYARRAGQVEMAVGVAETMEEGGILMVEAGTGVGKTFAYLIPAILWARAHAEQVVISTNTKNLQEQLIGKDLPLLAESLGIDFEAALLKGRSNYLCTRSFERHLSDALGSLIAEDRRATAYLVAWFAASDSCDLGQIPAEARHAFDSLPRMIAQIRSDRATCVGPGCRHARRCPLRVARARARNADIIVSNHALTLADTQFDVLPSTSRIIFDEAHNLESVATDQLGHEISNFSFREVRRALGGDGRRRSVRDSLARYLQSAHPQKTDAIAESQARLSAAATELGPVGESLGAAVIDLCTALDPEAKAGRARIRLGAPVYETPHWQRVAETVEQVRTLLDIIRGALSKVVEELSEGAERGSPESNLAMEAAGARGVAEDLLAAIASIMHDEPGAGYVLWAETVRMRWGDLWRLCAAPIDVGPALQQAVYSRRDSIVLTSATLTVDGGFKFMRTQLGLDDPDLSVRELMVPSPFHYREQLLMCVPDDLPTGGAAGHEEALVTALLDIAKTAEGGVLLLFTARNQMDRVYGRIHSQLAEAGLSPLCQYTSGPRSWLLEQLRERDNTVLFGLKSFWEGVDVPGQALRCVVIVKLPFAVPTDPIVESRCELAASRSQGDGGDYYIPETILGFKQGIGRLIRSVTDQGVVFVLDNRIVTRHYGRRFFASIPECRFAVTSFHECLLEAGRWLR